MLPPCVLLVHKAIAASTLRSIHPGSFKFSDLRNLLGADACPADRACARGMVGSCRGHAPLAARIGCNHLFVSLETSESVSLDESPGVPVEVPSAASADWRPFLPQLRTFRLRSVRWCRVEPAFRRSSAKCERRLQSRSQSPHPFEFAQSPSMRRCAARRLHGCSEEEDRQRGEGGRTTAAPTLRRGSCLAGRAAGNRFGPAQRSVNGRGKFAPA